MIHAVFHQAADMLSGGNRHRILRHRTHHEKRPRNLADLQHSLGDAFSIVSKVKFGTVKVCFDVSLPEPLQADRAEHALDDGVVEQPASPRGDGMARRRVEGDETIPDQRREARVVDDAQRSCAASCARFTASICRLTRPMSSPSRMRRPSMMSSSRFSVGDMVSSPDHGTRPSLMAIPTCADARCPNRASMWRLRKSKRLQRRRCSRRHRLWSCP